VSRGADLLRHFESRAGAAIDLLGRLVAIDSPTSEPGAVARMGAAVAAELAAFGIRATFPDPTDADVTGTTGALSARPLVATLGPRPGPAGPGAAAARPVDGHDASPAVLLGHLDTVWPMGETARRPFRVESGCAYGPGVYDMKAGIVAALLVAGAIAAGRVRPRRPVVLFLSADEETGSPASRPHLEDEARRCRFVLGLEPCNADGGAKTTRKGVARVRLAVTGVAAHTGIDPGRGVNAIEEIAAQILAVKDLADAARGTTVHAGLVSGGVARNVVAPAAVAEIDVRVPDAQEWSRVAGALGRLTPRHPGARLEVDAVLTHPPMVRTPAIAALFAAARGVAAEVGFDLGEGGTGGGSDGSHCAALGIPVLDGLGVEGEGAHAPGEHVRIDRIAPRAAFLARLLEIEDPV
jgi:glutamate carboxypeptidase